MENIFIRTNKRFYSWKVPGIAAYIFMLISTLIAAFWGTAEFFHEGWFATYTTFIYYLLPVLTLMCLTIISTFFPRLGGVIIIISGTSFTLWRLSMLIAWHKEIRPSLFITGLVIILPGFLFFLDGILKKKNKYKRSKKFSIKAFWKQSLVIVLTGLIILGLAIPMLINNLNRIPLKNYNETTIKGNNIALTFAGDGPGWFYSNKHPIIYKDKKHTGMSWNEIALFGMYPIGFENKKFGLSYKGTKKSIYYATQEDFKKYNMFRYINYEGTELTDEIQDLWRLPTIEEYVKIFSYRGENSKGFFDTTSGKAHYKHKPDKDAPIWAHNMEVIYYWTSTSFNGKNAYDISYSGRVRYISKTTQQDYRGYRAVRTKIK